MSNKQNIHEDHIEPSDQHDEDEERVLERDELSPIASPDNERLDAVSAGVLHSSDLGGAGHTTKQWHVDVGVDVVGSCGHKIGEVVDVRDDVVVVEKGFFMPEDVFIPKSAIAEVDAHHLTLNVSKESISHSDWDDDPEMDQVEDTRRAS